ncbi:DUF4878 domain-containing protein [Bacteroides sp. 51]|uniref:DUF4878 domain-containing protein n=1 Tax=Bacteroides sp. 51 TaxID=2302938 RepID=UPI0013D41D81|nr:DUF4878 domain-containing protein [Bacteroides sp. 51]NDV81368.1 DUF4878 domain-containing protein [Bacteroides sp. 51]
MKKVIYFSLFVLTLGIFAACSSSESPGEAAKKYAQYVADGKFDKFVDAIAFDESATSEQIKQQKDMLLALLQEKGQKTIDEKDGLKSIDIVSEVIDADGNNAKVILQQTYGNGDTENANYDMVKKNGTWKMVIKK